MPRTRRQAEAMRTASRTAPAEALARHVARLRACRRCPDMPPPVVSGGPVVSKVLLVGQAPGDKEPKLGRPFAWTAGKTLFRWFEQASGLTEAQFRATVYMAAVCRCFPGKKATGGDRVPSPPEVENCRFWLERELALLAPDLVIPVGRLAIEQFLPKEKLEAIIGKSFRVERGGRSLDCIPLPHPSGASPWHRMEPGQTLLKQALRLIAAHAAFRGLKAALEPSRRAQTSTQAHPNQSP
jgi:uracil-DNA glycosylase